MDIAASFDIPVMIHTCGSSSWIYEDFIEMGIRAVDTLQPEAVNMSPKYLLDHFGGRLNFHGCISTAMIANESAEGVTAICKDTLQLLMPTNGYHFAPTHAIQKIRRLRTSFRCIRRRTTSVHMIEGRMQAIAAHVRYGRARQVGELVRQMLDDGFEPLDVLNHGLIAGMNEIGIKFRDNEIFVPEVLIGARAMICGMNVLRPHIIRAQMYPVGRAIIGTVRGDIHDIGKNLVKMLMESKRIEVIDLGTDVHAGEFVRAARDYQAEIVCLSALLTTTMVSIEDVVKAFQQAGTRGDVKILIGGAPVTAAFCEHAGADIYTPDAASAAEAAVHAIEEIKQQRAQ
ncbi:MAG: cobalamin-dependent protein [Christensenellales bacterium]